MPPIYKHLYNKAKNRWTAILNESLNGDTPENLIQSTRFGFFGEFGYGLACWLPYLLYVSKTRGIKLKTIGPIGSSALHYFSSDHIEIDEPTHDSWGDAARCLQIRRGYSKRLKCPTNYGHRRISIAGIQWLHNNFHTNYQSENYAPLEFPDVKNPLSIKTYAVVNIKDYFNWSNTHIRNFFSTDDLRNIYHHCRKNGLSLVLNRFPAPREATNTYYDQSIVSDELLSLPGVTDMAPIYSECNGSADKNRTQITILKNAKLVFATQGGNGILSLICNRKVSLLMRGGFDYPDLVSLARLYKSRLLMAYEATDLLTLSSESK